MDSIMQNEKKCYVCNSVVALEKHHIMAGNPNRRHSDRLGVWCWLCNQHHTGSGGAQYDPDLNQRLKKEAQEAFEKTHSHDEWMAVFGKNYL